MLWSKFRELVHTIAMNPWQTALAWTSLMGQQFAQAGAALPIVDEIVAQLAAHEQRQRPLSWLSLPNFHGVLSEQDPPLLVSRFRFDANAVQRPLVHDADNPNATHPADYIAARARGAATSDDPADDPLFAQLLAATADTLSRHPRAQIDDAIATLAALPVDEIEWLLRETLGLGIHRLDAWSTATATERLRQVRDRQPTGLHVGSYAWVTDLDIPDRRSNARRVGSCTHRRSPMRPRRR